MLRFRYVALTVFFVCGLCLAGVAEAAEAKKLPSPQTAGGSGVFDALQRRASAAGGAFPTGAISQEELSTLLWAATGLNRPDKGWTVPMAMGREPYCRVYVTGKEGTFRYDWKAHSLVETSKEDARSTVSGQGFVAGASHVLIFVTDGKAIESFGGRGADWGPVLAGAMTQNVYLAAEALGIGGRYMASLKSDVVRSVCGLESADVPICIMPIGKK